jgi:hypothetical protein
VCEKPGLRRIRFDQAANCQGRLKDFQTAFFKLARKANTADKKSRPFGLLFYPTESPDGARFTARLSALYRRGISVF